jgi:hypothetical protein
VTAVAMRMTCYDHCEQETVAAADADDAAVDDDAVVAVAVKLRPLSACQLSVDTGQQYKLREYAATRY